MQRRQLVALFIGTFGFYALGNMVFGLLPVYAVELGMEEGTIGLFLGLAFAAITVGALSSSWFSDRFQRRKLTLILLGIPGIPASFLMGQTNNFVLLTIFTLIVWFVSGLGTATINILTGLHANPESRGRVFGILASASGLGIAVGNFAAGAVVDRWGYPALYGLAALAWLVPMAAAFFLDDSIMTRPPAGQPKPAAVPLSAAVWLLIFASILVSVTNFSSQLTRPLKMNGLAFEASAIAGATAISALVTLPLPFIVGWLSDRIGRKQLLIVGYLLMSLGMLVLTSAFELWQFWASASLFSLAGGTVGAANAYVTDLAPPQALSTALARYSATGWIGAIIGYVATGLIIQPLGLSTTLLIAASLPVLSVLMLLAIRPRVQLAPA